RVAVEEKFGLVIHALKAEVNVSPPKFFGDAERLFIHPGAPWNPFQQQTVALKIGVGNLPGLPQIMMDAAGHCRPLPEANIARSLLVRIAPAPVLAFKAFEQPIAAVE